MSKTVVRVFCAAPGRRSAREDTHQNWCYCKLSLKSHMLLLTEYLYSGNHIAHYVVSIYLFFFW